MKKEEIIKYRLEGLLESCKRLQFEMGGIDASKNCTPLLTKWDNRNPTIFYLERNMEWAEEVLKNSVEKTAEV